jgi:hypothetical protein
VGGTGASGLGRASLPPALPPGHPVATSAGIQGPGSGVLDGCLYARSHADSMHSWLASTLVRPAVPLATQQLLVRAPRG